MRFRRRQRKDPTLCGCPLTPSECGNKADGEDRLCDQCRENHRPDFIPDSDVIDNEAEYV
jgi:hypothetical protein